MKRLPKNIEKTQILWDKNLGQLQCQKCGAIIHWSFGFKTCPFCNRVVVKTDERRISI